MKTENELTAVVTIQAWWRGEQTRAKIHKLAKKLLKRKYSIRELIETEEKYIRDLSMVISDFKGNLLNKKIITQEQAQQLFCNIDEIRQLNELFFANIFSQAEQYSHHKIIFAKVEKEIPFFKIYFEYFNNYSKANALLDSLTQHNAEFKMFLTETRANPKYHLLTLKDFLIKPVQRLPKYVLLMREIKKLTPPEHPDLQNIEKVLSTFEQVNHSNNNKLNQVLNIHKVNEIQRNLLLSHTISEPGVQFVLEENVSVLSMDGEVKQGVLYLLNTELIVAKHSQKQRQRIICNVPFKHGGEIMQNEQHFYYKNSFTVQNGEGDSCTFVFDSPEEKENLLQKVFNELMKAEQRNVDKLATLCQLKNTHSVEFLKKMNRLDLLPEIEVLGTEERKDSMFKYTVYIIEVKIKSIRQKLFLRFSEVLRLQEIATTQGLTIKNQLLKTTWLLNHKPKKIEERKMNIQRFLKELLSKQEVVEHGEKILKALGLPATFYSLPEQFKESEEILKKSHLSQRSTNSQEDISKHHHSYLRNTLRHSKRSSLFNSIPELMVEPITYKNKARQISIQDILQANEINQGHFTRLSEAIYRCSQKQKKIDFDVLIPWLQNQKGFVRQRVSIPFSQKVYFLIEQVADQINLKYFKDFRLYLERQYANRLLDDDECLIKIAEEIKDGKYLLIFKKMIYLTPDIEERQIRADRVRLQIVASQAIYDCKKDKFLLTYSAILKLSALVGLSQLFKGVTPSLLPKSLPLELVRQRQLHTKTRQMVTNTFTSFYDSPQVWQTDYESMITHLFDKLKAICIQNSTTYRKTGLNDQQKEYNITNLAQLAAISIINEIKDNPFYGSISFVVQISQQFRHIIHVIHQNEDYIENRNCWLIVKYHQIYLYSISLQEQLFTIDYEDILKMVAYPAAIIMKLRGKEVDALKLKTTCSYSMRELILYYKQYNEMIQKMQQDNHFEQSILQLVRQYTHTNLESTHRKSLYE